MCYYNGQKVTRAEYIRLKNLEKLVANYDFLNRDLDIGFDYGLNAVLKPIEGKEDFDIVQMEWGFIPHYVPNREELLKMRKGGVNPKTGKFDPPILTLNAIGEEMFQKVSYKKSAYERRCLVLSSGFYEWRHIYPKNKRTGAPLKTAVKYPYHIYLPGKEYFFMAGIWTPWTDKNTGEHVESFAIVTTKANKLMEQVHNSKKRMPTILNEDLAYEWLFGKLDEKRISEIAATQYPSEEMAAHPIAKDFITALEPMAQCEYEDLPPIEGF
ncbi:SOS response-associated peptidase [Ferruginibacter albus]|uniref:SOS response-associated peptidase n=1 Tax=Ferruginibacter albus TaxID=2875540 RepID=UPI001CC536ED|nr:SOS response-associated peptidase family protein [Ferruginibacter albus]UAY53198.1 SOS response-associated peptidase [Ferruginibacter albus]